MRLSTSPSSASPNGRLAIAHWPGFTLLELVIVVGILVVVAGLVLPRIMSTSDTATQQATNATLLAVRQAIIGTDARSGYCHDMGRLPPTLAALYLMPAGAAAYSPATGRGWHGPYLTDAPGTYTLNVANGYTATYGNTGDPAPVDAWNHPIIIQFPDNTATTDPVQQTQFARLVSPGPDGIIQTPSSQLYPTATPVSVRGDDVLLFLLRPDISP